MKIPLLKFALLTAFVFGSVSAASAENPWTSVGSAGTVDEASIAYFDVTGAQIRIKSTAPAVSTVVVRYNVVVAGGVGDIGSPEMSVRFKDTGDGARVVAVLKGVHYTSGNTTTLLTVDSDTYSAAPDFQLQEATVCDGGPTFVWTEYAYYIEATITRTTTLAAPALQLLRIGVNPTPPTC